MDLRTLGNKIAVRPEIMSETDAGIILTTEQKTARGTVIAVGPGVENEKGKFVDTVVKVGDYIVYSKESGEEANVDGETLLFIKEDTVLTVIKDDE